jgi:hypothetical protein
VLDRSLSGSGVLTTDFFGWSDVANALALQGRKRVVAAGSAGLGEPGSVVEGFALARYRLTD